MEIAFLGLIATIVILAVLDLVAPARPQAPVRRWRLKGIAAFVMFFFVGGASPLLWDAFLAGHRLIDATALGTVGGAVVGVLVLQLFSYWWHRAMHRNPVLWRLLHQMHHSAERVDVFGAFWFHPLDVVGFALVGSLALVWALGVTADVAILANVITGLCATFQHSNIRTPQWLGYLVHRPENHSVHHERGVHAYNYGDIALWDLVFGTWKNPKDFVAEAGFYDGASSRIGEMLVFRDVSEPRNAEARATAQAS